LKTLFLIVIIERKNEFKTSKTKLEDRKDAAPFLVTLTYTMEESSRLQLWMIVPEEVMDSDEKIYFIINAEGQEFWFDITGSDPDFYREW